MIYPLQTSFLYQVVVVETIDKDESTNYSLPISTSIRFCPLYDPNDNLDEARRGFKFETVGDMMSRKTLPKVQCCVCVCVLSLIHI